MSLLKVFACIMMVNFACSSPILLNVIEKSIERERRDTTGCQIPPTLEDLFAELNQHINVTRFLIAKDAVQPASLITNELSNNEVYISQNTHGNTNCPGAGDSFNQDDPLWIRSTCPWYYESEELGSSYYPAHIPQAKCKCRSCIGSNNREECEKVRTNIRVLKKTGCKNGFYTYETELHEGISVGCTCARPRS
ncbi:hypothetical protein SNE40_006674 [Patella caerulea]|uniref:Interleukin 17-like protein n=1 Tax=Patella caerulea TaxID=87958 RepID=A0AAN8Q1B6_PATCE